MKEVAINLVGRAARVVTINDQQVWKSFSMNQNFRILIQGLWHYRQFAIHELFLLPEAKNVSNLTFLHGKENNKLWICWLLIYSGTSRENLRLLFRD